MDGDLSWFQGWSTKRFIILQVQDSYIRPGVDLNLDGRRATTDIEFYLLSSLQVIHSNSGVVDVTVVYLLFLTGLLRSTIRLLLLLCLSWSLSAYTSNVSQAIAVETCRITVATGVIGV